MLLLRVVPSEQLLRHVVVLSRLGTNTLETTATFLSWCESMWIGRFFFYTLLVSACPCFMMLVLTVDSHGVAYSTVLV